MEISEIKELGKKVEREYIEGDKNKIKEFGTEVSNLLEKLDNNCSFYSNSCVENCLGKEFRLALKNNVKPSDFFKSNINRMQGFISDELLPYFYISLDSVNLWQIDRGHSYRQSYRAKSDYLCADKRRRTVHLVEVLDFLGNVDISVGIVELLSDKLVTKYGSKLLGGHGLECCGVKKRSGLVFHIGAHVVPLRRDFVFFQINFIGDFVFRHRDFSFQN